MGRLWNTSSGGGVINGLDSTRYWRPHMTFLCHAPILQLEICPERRHKGGQIRAHATKWRVSVTVTAQSGSDSSKSAAMTARSSGKDCSAIRHTRSCSIAA